MKNNVFQSRDLCLRALDTNSLCAKNVRRKGQKMELKEKYIPRILLVFVIGGIFGFIYEEIFYRIDLGYFVKRGTTYGPWIPIYGFGAVAILLLTRRYRSSPLKVFILSQLITGTLELLTGLILHRRFGVRLWDYNVEIWNWLNIGGYICLRSVLFFGVSGLLLSYVVYPLIYYVTEPMEEKKVIVLAALPSTLFILDILVNLIKVIRFGY